MNTSPTRNTRAGRELPRGVKADRLRNEFRDRGRKGAGGELLLWSNDALDLVDRAADEGVPIVRVTGIAPASTSSAAAADERVDFSREVSGGHGCWEAADAFLRRRGELGLLFDLELGDDPLEIV